MSVWETLLLAFSVSLDAFALSVAGALTSRQKTYRNALLAAGFFGGFQFFMPLLGFLAAFIKAGVRFSQRNPGPRSEEDGPDRPEEISLDIGSEDEPEAVEMIIADYDDIDNILSSTDEFLKSLTGYPGDVNGGDGE